tara:strand:+ start:1011 stop:1349 length:339 start_codon:yes stop_codon:yes gene_type:complete
MNEDDIEYNLRIYCETLEQYYNLKEIFQDYEFIEGRKAMKNKMLSVVIPKNVNSNFLSTLKKIDVNNNRNISFDIYVSLVSDSDMGGFIVPEIVNEIILLINPKIHFSFVLT